MRKLIYEIEGYTSVYNPKTDEIEEVLSPVSVVVYNPTDEDIAHAKEIAYNGEYTIEGEIDRPSAPRNVLAGEYITVDGVLYKTTENIPVGEPIIAGHNAIVTTVEDQLRELTKGE